MAMMRYKDLKRQIGYELHPVIFMVIDDFMRGIRGTTWKNGLYGFLCGISRLKNKVDNGWK